MYILYIKQIKCSLALGLSFKISMFNRKVQQYSVYFMSSNNMIWKKHMLNTVLHVSIGKVALIQFKKLSTISHLLIYNSTSQKNCIIWKVYKQALYQIRIQNKST